MVVVLSNAIVDPRTVVVHLRHTTLADRAVVRTCRFTRAIMAFKAAFAIAAFLISFGRTRPCDDSHGIIIHDSTE